MTLVADKKPKPGKTDPPKREGVPLHVWLDPALMGALQSYLKSLKHPSTKTAVTEAALRKFLRDEGFWPPAEQDGG